MIEAKPGITDAEILSELAEMTPQEILSIPLSGRFTGLFEGFSEMGAITAGKQSDAVTISGQKYLDTEKEIWKHIDGYEDLYHISNLGRVKALAKTVRNNSDSGRFLTEQIIKPIVQHSGYAHVGLWRNQQCKQARLHRLVAFAFCDNDDPEHKTQVNHINENKLDNRAQNLEWVTPKQNTNHGNAIANRIYGRIKAVDCFDLEGNFICTYKSQADANAACGVARNDGHIAACCKNKQLTAYGYKWAYHIKEVRPCVRHTGKRSV